MGLDIGDRRSHYCLIDDHGEILEQGTAATTHRGVVELAERLKPHRVALENGTHAGWISRTLHECSRDVIVANTWELRKISQSQRKNDRSDAEVLARLARVDPTLLSPITFRAVEQQTDLATIKGRDVLVRARTSCVNAIRGLLKSFGTRLPTKSPKSVLAEMLVNVPEALRVAIPPLLESIESINEQIKKYDHEIARLAEERYASTELLQQVTGVGQLTALTYILTIGNPGRFAKSRDVGAYLGLTPRQRDSGELHSQLRISKAGNAIAQAIGWLCSLHSGSVWSRLRLAAVWAKSVPSRWKTLRNEPSSQSLERLRSCCIDSG